MKCKKCGKDKPHTEFYASRTSQSGQRGNCKDCDKKLRKRYGQQNPRRHLKSNFGIDVLEFERMFIDQGGRCKICNRMITLLVVESDKNNVAHVDHCHITSIIRGLLCNKCNSALGYFNDDFKLIERAAEYLRTQGKFNGSNQENSQ